MPLYIPTSHAKGYQILHLIPTFLTVLLITVILVGVKWYLIVFSISISLMTNDVGHFFMCRGGFSFLYTVVILELTGKHLSQEELFFALKEISKTQL